MNKTIRTYKASELYTKLYGRQAYKAWKAREAEIDLLMRRGAPRNAVVKMREDNFRRMKAAGEKMTSESQVMREELVRVVPAA